MTTFDLLALGFIMLTMFVATMRGLVGEVASLFGWIVSFMAAKLFAPQFADIAFVNMQPRVIAVAISFMLIFVVMMIVLRLFRTLITTFLQSMGLNGVNRFLGACFGAIKGVIIVTLAVMICSFTDLPKTPAWRNSATASTFGHIALLAVPYLPSSVIDKLSSSTVR
ncbi:MAG: CvpA family protein [Snodgrassella sp.]|nr:CvpA family protein [Snodgrassella sp.]